MIYIVKKLYMDGRELPKHRLGMVRGTPAVLNVREGLLHGLNGGTRTSKIATLRDPNSNHELDRFPPLYDVVMSGHLDAELCVFGIEKNGVCGDLHHRQGWLLQMADLEEVPEYLGMLEPT